MVRTTATLAPFQQQDVNWRDSANRRCASMDPALFFPEDEEGEELPYPTPEAVDACNRCEVRTQCLAWALANDPYGTWGGTSQYQRRQLKRKASRVACPTCGAQEITAFGRLAACIKCGASWFTN